MGRAYDWAGGGKRGEPAPPRIPANTDRLAKLAAAVLHPYKHVEDQWMWRVLREQIARRLMLVKAERYAGARRFATTQSAYNRETMASSEIIFSVQESPEGGYEARALGHPIFTQADSLDELKEIVRDAVACHFDPKNKPSVIRLHMVKDEVIPA